MRRLDGRRALVTGGAAGIGLATARRLRDEGAEVVITDLARERGEAVAAEHGLTFLATDVTSEADWARVADAVGAPDVLVNNAALVGSHTDGNPETTGLADLRRVFAVNVEGTLLGCRTALRLMRDRGGSIVNIASVAADTATPFLVSYGASKAAVWQLTKSVAQYACEQGWPTT